MGLFALQVPFLEIAPCGLPRLLRLMETDTSRQSVSEFVYYEIAEGEVYQYSSITNQVTPQMLHARIQYLCDTGIKRVIKDIPDEFDLDYHFQSTVDDVDYEQGLLPGESNIPIYKGCLLSPLRMSHPSSVYVRETVWQDLSLLMNQTLGREFVGLRQYTDCVVAILPPLLLILAFDRIIIWQVPNNETRSEKYLGGVRDVTFSGVVELQDLCLHDVMSITPSELEDLLEQLKGFTLDHLNIYEILTELTKVDQETDLLPHHQSLGVLAKTVLPPQFEFISLLYTHTVSCLMRRLYDVEAFLGVIKRSSTQNAFGLAYKMATPRIVISAMREVQDYLKSISRRAHQCIHVLASGELCNVIGLGIRENTRDFIHSILEDKPTSPSASTAFPDVPRGDPSSSLDDVEGMTLARRLAIRLWDSGFRDPSHTKRLIVYIYSCSRVKKLSQMLIELTDRQTQSLSQHYTALRLRYASLGLIFNIVSCGFVASSLYYGLYGTNIDWMAINGEVSFPMDETGETIGGTAWAITGIVIGVVIIAMLLIIHIILLHWGSMKSGIGDKLGFNATKPFGGKRQNRLDSPKDETSRRSSKKERHTQTSPDTMHVAEIGPPSVPASLIPPSRQVSSGAGIFYPSSVVLPPREEPPKTLDDELNDLLPFQAQLEAELESLETERD